MCLNTEIAFSWQLFPAKKLSHCLVYVLGFVMLCMFWKSLFFFFSRLKFFITEHNKINCLLSLDRSRTTKRAFAEFWADLFWAENTLRAINLAKIASSCFAAAKKRMSCWGQGEILLMSKLYVRISQRKIAERNSFAQEVWSNVCNQTLIEKYALK